MDGLNLLLDRLIGLSATSANEITTTQVCVRAVVVYGLLILFVRLGKKRFLGRATAFDAILIVLIGSVASRTVSGTAPFLASLAATLCFIAIHWIISYFARSSPTLSYLVKGRDTVVMRNGRVDAVRMGIVR
jgi:uncharacterized membrane protein YcaP (DUF421 family)